jgi:hypothetical protein
MLLHVQHRLPPFFESPYIALELNRGRKTNPGINLIKDRVNALHKGITDYQKVVREAIRSSNGANAGRSTRVRGTSCKLNNGFNKLDPKAYTEAKNNSPLKSVAEIGNSRPLKTKLTLGGLEQGYV